MAIEGKEVFGVKNANPEKTEWEQSGLKAHSATVDDDAAFEKIKKVDMKEGIYTKKK
jgi:hypothetical protein